MYVDERVGTFNSLFLRFQLGCQTWGFYAYYSFNSLFLRFSNEDYWRPKLAKNLSILSS